MPGRSASLGLKPLTVPVKVERQGQNVQVLVKVTIKGKPFYFIVDTGATVTLIDSTIAQSLNLPTLAKSGTATTIACSVPIQPVTISGWSIGGESLPTSVIPSEKTDFAGKKLDGVPIAGLLGADLYYLYGTMTLNFKAATLSLGNPAPTSKLSFPLASTVTAGGVSVLANATVHGVPAGFIIDTGASVSELDGALAQKAGLKKAGTATTIGAVACSASLQPVTFNDVHIGSVTLPTVVAGSSTSALTAQTKGAVQGLIGADILSTYGSVTFDFNNQKVLLG